MWHVVGGTGIRLTARKRASHFRLLSDEEVESMERAVQSAYGVDPDGVAEGALS